MSQKFTEHLRGRSLAYISLVLSFLEIAILMCVRMFATHPIADSVHSVAIKRMLGITVLFGGPLAILVGLVGIVFDSRKVLAVVAFPLGLVCWFLSFLQTLV
jgi:hypothetical protein